MNSQFQSTVRRAIRFAGTGLHSGRRVHLEILPAAANTGIVFQRTDLQDAPQVPATVDQISSTELSTTIGRGSWAVSTIEHLMAAFAGLGVDNALVRLDGPEVPILDGSAAPFVDKLLAAGIAKVDGFRKLLVVRKPFEVRQGDRLMRVEPAERLTFDIQIEYASAAIGRQALSFTFGRSSFIELCESRTFCHVREVDAMRAAGLALGGSLDNAVVVTDSSVLNAEGLRCQDEFVRHKLLDCVGDLMLLGAPLVGHVTLVKNGHGLHAAFMKELTARAEELLAEVMVGPMPEPRAAMPEGLQILATASAMDG